MSQKILAVGQPARFAPGGSSRKMLDRRHRAAGPVFRRHGSNGCARVAKWQRRGWISLSEGKRLRDGKQLIDASSGLWNVPLGHGHPAPLAEFIASAPSVQTKPLTQKKKPNKHTTPLNPFTQTSAVLDSLSERLTSLGGSTGVAACSTVSSGSEAVRGSTSTFHSQSAGRKVRYGPSRARFMGLGMGAAMLTSFPSVWREFMRMERFVKSMARAECLEGHQASAFSNQSA